MSGEDRTKQYRTAMDSSEIPDGLVLSLDAVERLRYGENPNQAAILAMPKDLESPFKLIKNGKGGMSATNWLDVGRGYDLLKHFDDTSVAVMKHAIPSGFASKYGDRTSQDEVYIKARDVDRRAAFGSVVAFNTPLTKASAEVLTSTFVEAVLAPGYETGVMEILEKKDDIRAIEIPDPRELPKYEEDSYDHFTYASLPGGLVLVQKPYLTGVESHEDIQTEYTVENEGQNYTLRNIPTIDQLKEMEFAWKVNFGVRSNGIVFTKDRATVAIGTGEQERVGAVEQAIVKAYQKEAHEKGIEFNPLEGISQLRSQINPLEGAICSSDAFFPKPDSIDVMNQVGVKGIIQPGGSKGDYAIIDAINKYNMVMGLADKRCFGHF